MPVKEFHNKSRVLFIIAALLVSWAYAWLRLRYSYEYPEASWASLLDFTAPRPFVCRALVPALANFVIDATGLPVARVFFAFEFLAALMLVVGVSLIVRRWLCRGRAECVAVICPMVVSLPMVFLNALRAYYPSDTPALAFIAWGLCAIFEQKWLRAALITAIATLNRETALVIPIAAFFILYGTMPLYLLLQRCAPLFCAWLASKVFVGVWFRDNPGVTIALYQKDGWILSRNLEWLLSPLNDLTLATGFFFLPFFWIAYRGKMPALLRRLELPALILFSILIVSGNIFEMRVFADVVLLLYIPVAVVLAGP